MTKYIFTHESETERDRLRQLEVVLDPGTVRQLEALGVSAGWRCLEVAGGAGSIAAWLCERVGATGHVTATDVDIAFLSSLHDPNLEVLQHDILKDDLPAAHFDLVHARALIEHLPSKDQVLGRMIEALKPGGWLLVEDVDLHIIMSAEQPETPFTEPIREAIRTLVAVGGYDPFYGRRLYWDLQSHGLIEVGAEGRAYVQPGGASGTPRVWGIILERIREEVLARGNLSAEELENALQALEQPQYGVMTPLVWAAWGKRPIPNAA